MIGPGGQASLSTLDQSRQSRSGIRQMPNPAWTMVYTVCIYRTITFDRPCGRHTGVYSAGVIRAPRGIRGGSATSTRGAQNWCGCVPYHTNGNLWI